MGDHVFLKVIPKRGVVRFGKRGKLASRYIRPFEILERVGTVAYRLALPLSLLGVHEVFHVSILQKYTPNPAHVVDWGEIMVDTDETFKEEPVHILDSRDQVLRRKIVQLVKVLWQHRGVEEATWEWEDTMRATYLCLFEDEGALSNIDTRISITYPCVVCASVCEFRDEILLSREELKPRKNSIFLKKGKTIISVKNLKFSRSLMMKWASLLESSCEILLPRRISSDSKIVGISRFSRHRV